MSKFKVGEAVLFDNAHKTTIVSIPTNLEGFYVISYGSIYSKYTIVPESKLTPIVIIPKHTIIKRSEDWHNNLKDNPQDTLEFVITRKELIIILSELKLDSKTKCIYDMFQNAK